MQPPGALPPAQQDCSPRPSPTGSHPVSPVASSESSDTSRQKWDDLDYLYCESTDAESVLIEEGVQQGGQAVLPKQLLPQECPFHRDSVQASLETVPGAKSACSRDDVLQMHTELPEQVYPAGQQDDTSDFTSHA